MICSAAIYPTLGADIDPFTPIFAASSIFGWTAHIIEPPQYQWRVDGKARCYTKVPGDGSSSQQHSYGVEPGNTQNLPVMVQLQKENTVGLKANRAAKPLF